jgi:hypothetical protein
VKSRELLSWFTDRFLAGVAHPGGFTLWIVSCREIHPDSPQKIALRLDLPADRVLAALKRIILQTEQTGWFSDPNPSHCWNTRWGVMKLIPFSPDMISKGFLEQSV